MLRLFPCHSGFCRHALIDKDTEDAPKIRVYIKQKEADLANAHGTAAGLADTLAAVCAASLPS